MDILHQHPDTIATANHERRPVVAGQPVRMFCVCQFDTSHPEPGSMKRGLNSTRLVPCAGIEVFWTGSFPSTVRLTRGRSVLVSGVDDGRLDAGGQVRRDQFAAQRTARHGRGYPARFGRSDGDPGHPRRLAELLSRPYVRGIFLARLPRPRPDRPRASRPL